MKIAFLSPGWPPSDFSSGIVTCISVLREQLGMLGHDVFVIAMRTKNAVQEDGIYHLPDLSRKPLVPKFALRVAEKVYPGYGQYVQSPREILKLLRKLNNEIELDLVVMEESLGWCGVIAKKLPVPVVATLHGPWFLCSGDGRELSIEDRKRIKAEGKGLRGVAAVTSPSKFTLDSARRFYGLNHQQATAIPNSMMVAEEAAALWSFEACDRNNILFVGRFDRLKGADIALDVFNNLARERKDLTLTFVGPDRGLRLGDGSEYSWNEYLERFLPPAARARITYTGEIRPDQIAELRRRSFITLVCSRYETFPFTLLEAHSMGCPVVATEVGGIPEIIQDGRNGLLAASNNVDGLTEKISSLLANPEFATSLGQQGRKDCIERYDAKKIALQTLEFYESVVAQFRAPAGLGGE